MDIDKLLGDEVEAAEEVVETPKPVKKAKGKPRGGNSPMIGDNMLMVEGGDNAKFLSKNLYLMNLPDIDMHNVDEVQERINHYFEYMVQCDSKPTVSGLAMALNGMSRRTLWAIVNDAPTGGSGYNSALPPEVALAIKKAHKIMETLWEDYMQNGKINPVAGIFLGKNNYGYQDKTEYVLTPNAQQDNDYNADNIRDRYLPTSDYKQIGASNSDDEN